MEIFIKSVIIVASLVLIILVALQESKSDGTLGVIGGGAEQLFGKKRSKPMDRFFHKGTIICAATLFIAVCIGIIVIG